jgi:pimeloyl-ACP methyl ester carboxylesterase
MLSLIVVVLVISEYSAKAEVAAAPKPDLAETSQFIKTAQNRTLYVTALKPFKDCAIVFLHGLLASSQYWINQYQIWDDKCSTILYDMYGHGVSTGYLETPDDQVLVKDLQAVLLWSKAKKYVLVGHNFGGIAIQQYIKAKKDPKIAAMVLVDSFVGNPNPNREGGDGPILTLLASNVKRQQSIITAVQVFIKPAKPADIPQPGWEIIAGSGLITNYDAAAQIILTNSSFTSSNFTKPVLITFGTLDGISTAGSWADLHKSYKNSKLAPIEDASHTPFIQFPDQFNVILQDFLDKTDWTV